MNQPITEARINAMECGPMSLSDEGREFLADVRQLLFDYAKLLEFTTKAIGYDPLPRQKGREIGQDPRPL